LNFNQPKFCANATTFANSAIVDARPHAIFIYSE